MARTPMTFNIPNPPPDVALSPVANKTADSAVDWLRSVLDIHVTTRYIKTQTEAGELRCQIVAGKRLYSTAELYKFILSRPGQTKGSKRHKGWNNP